MRDFDDSFPFPQAAVIAAASTDDCTATPTDLYTTRVPIDITYDFKCPNFLAAVQEYLSTPTDYPIYDTDVVGIRGLLIGDRDITSLDGIEHFTSLVWLDAHMNPLTEIDLSNNTALEWLSVGSSHLTTLDLSNNTALTFLHVNDSQLTTLNLSNNTALTGLEVNNNQLTELDVSNNTLLRTLWAGNNHLTTLDLSNNMALTTLNVRNNQLSELDVRNTSLTSLNVQFNYFASPDYIIGWREIGLILGLNYTFFPQRDSVWEVTVTPRIVHMQAGDTRQFTANVISTGSYAGTAVTWSVIGNNATGTTINANGLLTVAEGETAANLTVRATSTFDTSVYGTAAVVVAGAAISDPTLTISTTFACAGSEAAVQIRMDDNPGFAAMMMRLTFDDRLTFTGYELGHPRMSTAQLEDLRDGFVSDGYFMGWTVRESNMNFRGLLLTLTFDVCAHVREGDFLPVEAVFDNALSTSDIPTNAEGEELNNISITNGGVMIEPYDIGDANRDGRTTSADGTVLARYLAGHNVRIDRRGMDLNLDEHVDGADLILFANWLVGHGIPPAAQ